MRTHIRPVSSQRGVHRANYIDIGIFLIDVIALLQRLEINLDLDFTTLFDDKRMETEA